MRCHDHLEPPSVGAIDLPHRRATAPMTLMYAYEREP
jgi:hypothetical protein